MSYEDSNTGGRYGTGGDDNYGDSTRTNVRDRDTQQTSSSEGGYGYGGDDNTNTRYGDSTRTNIKDTNLSSNTDPDTTLQPSTGSRSNRYNAGDGDGDGNMTSDYEASGLSSNDSYNQTSRLNQSNANQPQQSTTTPYDRTRESQSRYNDDNDESLTGGGLGESDNRTSEPRTTGGAGQDRDQYGVGPGRTYDQEVGGIGGRPERFAADNTDDTGYGASGNYGDDNDDGTSDKKDSTKGKLMQKAGSLLGNKKLERKGEEARESAGGSYGSGGDEYNTSGGGGRGNYGADEDTSSKSYGGRDGAGQGGNARYDGI